MKIEDRTNATPVIHESVARKHWMPIVLPYGEDSSWRRFFRCCRACPDCRHDLSTNGSGTYRCPACGYEERDGRRDRRERSCA